MSAKYTCDRCGNPAGDRPVTLYSLRDGFGPLDRMRLDFCAECADRFRDFMRDGRPASVPPNGGRS
jgi:hypothetical protein